MFISGEGDRKHAQIGQQSRFATHDRSSDDAMQRAELVARRVAQIGEVQLAKPPSRTPGGSSIEVPPAATPASCHAFACSGPSIAKPMVQPLPAVAGWPSIGAVTRNSPPLCI